MPARTRPIDSNPPKANRPKKPEEISPGSREAESHQFQWIGLYNGRRFGPASGSGRSKTETTSLQPGSRFTARLGIRDYPILPSAFERGSEEPLGLRFDVALSQDSHIEIDVSVLRKNVRTRGGFASEAASHRSRLGPGDRQMRD